MAAKLLHLHFACICMHGFLLGITELARLHLVMDGDIIYILPKRNARLLFIELQLS